MNYLYAIALLCTPAAAWTGAGEEFIQSKVRPLMGCDHEKATSRHVGRNYRLTDAAGHPVKEILS